MTVMVKKVGGSVAVIIPKSIAQDMGLIEGMPLDITSSADSIVMRQQGRRPRRAMSDIVGQIRSVSYARRRRELGEDRAVGKEVW
ncbi:MAG TPA: hypothetical protein VHD56_02935 [Tepidisphaeraceae bacterium]|nr:hypothetical protein [Tepidisphaeraceae bacterium]